MKVRTKLKYARIIANWAFSEFETFSEGRVGEDLMYLMLALLDKDESAWVDWSYFTDEEHHIFPAARRTSWFKILQNAGVIHI